jgi:hypothetical protein
MSFAAWASLPRRTTATVRSPSEAVDSPDKAGIFDRQLKVDSNGKAGTWNALCSVVRKPASTPTPHLLVSADSKRLAGEFFVSADSKGVISPLFPAVLVSADSKGVISPLFPADPRGVCKCGL